MLKFFLSLQVLVEIIRFKITIYLVIKQNSFEFSSESRVHENEHPAGKSPGVSWFIETKSDIQAQRTFRPGMSNPRPSDDFQFSGCNEGYEEKFCDIAERHLRRKSINKRRFQGKTYFFREHLSFGTKLSSKKINEYLFFWRTP